MKQTLAVALAALFLGVGLAGQPLLPLRVVAAAIVLGLLALIMAELARQLPRHLGNGLAVFVMGFLGTMIACYTQIQAVYPGTGVVGFGLGALAAASLGRRDAPKAIAVIGVVVGTGLFFLL